MENSKKIFIPYFCFCSEGSFKRLDTIGSWNSLTNREFLNFEFVKSLCLEKSLELNKPSTFWSTIREVFNEVEHHYDTDQSKLIINSLKQLITLSGNEIGLPEMECGGIIQLVISNGNHWCQFMDNLENHIYSMDGICYTYFSDIPIVFCVRKRDKSNNWYQLTEIMISDVDDYKTNQLFN